MTAVTPASCLRLAEAITGEASEYLVIHELKAALKALVELTTPKEDKP